MNGENIRLACVGLGRWAGVLAEGIRKTPGLEITACHTRSEARKEAFARKYGCRPFPGYPAILEDPHIDAVVLTTPHSAHKEQVCAAARAGKHVFVEKPLAVTLEDARACVEACGSAGVVLMVGHCWRWVASVQKEKSLVDAGALRFASGPIAQVSSSFVTQRRYQLSLFGTEANLYLNADPGGGTPAAPDLVIHRRGEEAPEAVAVEQPDMIARHMASFAKSVRGEAPPFTDGREGAALVALLSAMLESSKTGGWAQVEAP